jgi:O-antigen/teichoic acid export membrane protein
MSEQSLKDKTVKGVAWSGIDNIASFAVSFLVGIILARLLSPDDYGLLGIVGIFTTVCTAIVNGGMSNALIRKKNATEDDYNTVFIANLGMSILLYALIFLSAPFIADFFGRSELTMLTRISTLSLVVGSLAMVQRTRLTKRIDFKTQTKITLTSSITSGVEGVTMALLGYGGWALVGRRLPDCGLCRF